MDTPALDKLISEYREDPMNSMIFEFMELILYLLLGIQEKQSYICLLDVDEFVNKYGHQKGRNSKKAEE